MVKLKDGELVESVRKRERCVLYSTPMGVCSLYVEYLKMLDREMMPNANKYVKSE